MWFKGRLKASKSLEIKILEGKLAVIIIMELPNPIEVRAANHPWWYYTFIG